MERHKNYQDILRKHRRRQRSRLVRILLYLLALIALLAIIFLGLNQITKKQEKENNRPVTAQISRPDMEYSPNNYNYGAPQKPPA
jgi:cytochrome oxidase assembly protein ShyY1